MEIFSKTDIGMRRNENQDAMSYGVVSPSCVWSCVCDGMGGAKGGSVASTTAVEIISDYLNKNFNENTKIKDIPAILVSALEKANDEIYVQSCTEELSGMGTTCDVVIVRDESVYCVHVGDSRTYLVRGGKIMQITEDHSVVQEMVKRGELTPEQAEQHPNKNFITRALGINSQVHIDYIEADFKYGDVILMCTDGLTNNVKTADIVKILHENRGEDMTNKLVGLANDNGGSDNITVTVIY